MYKHQEESIENMQEYFRKQGAIALMLIGSVAKGTERADSDLDCAVVLSEVESISDETSKLVILGRQLAISQNEQDADSFVKKFLEITSYIPPKDMGVVLTRYSKDFQEWWREPRPNINEW